jgi:SNF2 family DNA or RNA helicase
MPELFEYQRTGARWLAGGTSRMLADEMGLGKSAQAVGALDELGGLRATVICPAIMCSAWADTFRDFGDVPRSVGVIRSGRPPDNYVAICSYERASQPEITEHLARRGGHLVVDESHYIKEPDAKRTRAVLQIAQAADRVSFLSGTPIVNHAGELYPMLRHCGYFRGTYSQFLARYCVTRETDHGFSVLAHRNVDELRSLLSHFMLRRQHAIELPPTRWLDLRADLSQCDTRSDAFRELRRLAPHAAGRAAAVARTGDLKALEDSETAYERRLVGMLKVPIVAREAIDVLDRRPTNKIVLFTYHTAVLEALAATLAPWGVVTLDGSTPEKQRGLRVKQFQTGETCRVAICQMKAAGVGITLTAANHLRIVEPSWTPAENDQAAKRIVRIGQTRPTTVGTWFLSGSIDDATERVLRRKARLIDEIVN